METVRFLWYLYVRCQIDRQSFLHTLLIIVKFFDPYYFFVQQPLSWHLKKRMILNFPYQLYFSIRQFAWKEGHEKSRIFSWKNCCGTRGMVIQCELYICKHLFLFSTLKCRTFSFQNQSAKCFDFYTGRMRCNCFLKFLRIVIVWTKNCFSLELYTYERNENWLLIFFSIFSAYNRKVFCLLPHNSFSYSK